MRNLITDIVFSLFLAIGILVWQHREPPSIPLNFSDIQTNNVAVTSPAMVLFWDRSIKSSHRAIQLLQRFHQAHPDIQLYLVHHQTHTDETLTQFLIDFGVYTTPLYSEHWPNQIPNVILINDGIRKDLSHPPHYTQLMEFFNKEF